MACSSKPHHTFSFLRSNHHSTGKRRYGHPALNGVLPEPWLPLKKDQALVNNRTGVGNGIRSANKDSWDQAVVLTLRKRYSTARNRGQSRQSAVGGGAGDWDGNAHGGVGSAVTTPVDPITVIDPWQDASTSTSHQRRVDNTRRSRTLNHRLSYDHASGVIMLPDEAEWLENDVDSDEADSDDVDYGTELERSVTSLAGEGESSPLTLESRAVDGGGTVGQTGQGQTQASPRISRYGTYFHHPERRRQNIPGAFPVR